jgi:purine-nucleoside phosphorylase
MELLDHISEAADYLFSFLSATHPKIGIVLGSGLGSWADGLDDRVTVDMSKIPHWPVPTVEGHSGQIVLGKKGKAAVLCSQGRLHYYEGHAIQEVVFPIRVLGRMGIRRLIVTNAAGGLNPDFSPGDLMLITDHINMMGVNPLIGSHDPALGMRFPDMTDAYDAEYIALAEDAAREQKLSLKKGVLVAVSGPSYETAAEVRMLRSLGGDAVCMSTVPEVIAGVQMGMRILGISCITNMATGLSQGKLSHDEVRRIPTQVIDRFGVLLNALVSKIFGIT